MLQFLLTWNKDNAIFSQKFEKKEISTSFQIGAFFRISAPYPPPSPFNLQN